MTEVQLLTVLWFGACGVTMAAVYLMNVSNTRATKQDLIGAALIPLIPFTIIYVIIRFIGFLNEK